jgi:hypothetical protein
MIEPRAAKSTQAGIPWLRFISLSDDVGRRKPQIKLEHKDRLQAAVENA